MATLTLAAARAPGLTEPFQMPSPSHSVKWRDGFQEDNTGHQVVILDDLHPKWSGKELLKNWGDRYAFMDEFKGGSL